jgi:hypothetical protein
MAWFRCTTSGGNGADLVVTCDSVFAGRIITCTDGTKTYTKTCPSSSPYEVTFKSIPTGTWTISGVYSGRTFSTTKTILDFTEVLSAIPEGSTVTPTDDIQTWLHCANIWNKNYTTISQVLADGTTLTALIASSNAVDYMVRSTTWASDVCANSYAMTKIGANNYCADTLLGNSSWLSAICSSTYFESVLNVKIPTMTSNTAPSGVASGSSHYPNSGNYNYDYYTAFDSSSTSAWIPASSDTIANCYIQYDFGETINAYAFFVHTVSFNAAKVQGYNGSSVTDIKTMSTITQDTIVPFDSVAQYKAFRFKPTGSSSVITNSSVSTFRVYGRKDV